MTEEIKKEDKRSPKKDIIFVVGKRKNAVARLRLYQSFSNLLVLGEKVKKGDIFINDKRIDNYFRSEIAKVKYLEPLKSTNSLDKYVLTFKLSGGGQNGQLDAVIHAMSRALSELDIKNRQILKKKGFLTRDARVRERRKVGMGGKARRKRQSPKR